MDGGSIDDESVALDGLAGGEVDEELVVLRVDSVVAVDTAVLDALEGADGAVIDGDVPGIQLLEPLVVLALGGSLASRGVGAVHESDDVGVLSVGLEDTSEDIGDI